jgi:hypothetical protein
LRVLALRVANLMELESLREPGGDPSKIENASKASSSRRSVLDNSDQSLLKTKCGVEEMKRIPHP